MPGKQKRKRKRTSDANRTPAKRARKNVETTPKSAKSDKKTPVKKRKFRRKPLKIRTKKRIHRAKSLRFLRDAMAKTLERALVEAPKIPLIYHLFTERDSMGTPMAPLNQVLKQLKVSDYVKNHNLLGQNHLLSLTRFTTMFAVEREGPLGRLYLKYWPIYDKQEATIYVDNLPEGCNEAKLMRLAKCFGSVAELRISKKNARWIRPRVHPKKKSFKHYQHEHIRQVNRNPEKKPKKKKPVEPVKRVRPEKKPLINVGSRPRQFGFIRFVDMDSARNMIAEFKYNDPSVPYEKFEAKKREELRAVEQEFLEFGPGDPESLAPPVVPEELPRQKPVKESFMMKLISEIRFLAMRRKRRTWPMYHRLRRLRRRLWQLRVREYRCLRKAGLVEKIPRIRDDSDWRSKQAQKYRRLRAEKRRSREERNQNPDEPSTSEAGEDTPRKKKKLFKKKKKRDRKTETIAQWLKRRTHNYRNSQRQKAKIKLRIEQEEADRAERRAQGIESPVKTPEPVEPVPFVKHKRKRKKMSRNRPEFIPGGQVRRYFDQTQVISMKRYLELKDEYLELVRKEKEKVRDEQAAAQIPDDIDL